MEFNFAAFDRKPSLRERLGAKNGWAIKLCIGIGLAFLVFGVLLMTLDPDTGSLVVWLLFAGMAFVAAYIVYIANGRIIQMNEFASQNHLTYVVNQAYDQRAGMIFGVGHSRVFPQLLLAEGRDFVELGNYQYTTGSGKSRQTHDFGFLRIKLPRRLPNMVLDSRKNNLFGKLSNLPVGFSKDQRLSLEGDFDNYFTLYAPAQYKTDALYVFTPDVMQALITAAHAYDCEVIDDDFYIYSSDEFDFADVQQLQELTVIAATLRPELIAQTDYYADARVGNRALNSIAPAGSRLKTRVSFWTIVGIILLVLYYVGMVVSGLI